MKPGPNGCWVKELHDLEPEEQERIRENFELLVAAGFEGIDDLDVIPSGFARFYPEDSEIFREWEQRQPEYWIRQLGLRSNDEHSVEL